MQFKLLMFIALTLFITACGPQSSNTEESDDGNGTEEENQNSSNNAPIITGFWYESQYVPAEQEKLFIVEGFDPDEDGTSFEWEQISGDPLATRLDGMQDLYITAPFSCLVERPATFQVTLSDQHGLSVTDTINVVAMPFVRSQLPEKISIDDIREVTLHTPFDIGGLPVTYNWENLSAHIITFDSTAKDLTFTPPDVSEREEIVFRLTLTCDSETLTRDVTFIVDNIVNDNLPPNATDEPVTVLDSYAGYTLSKTSSLNRVTGLWSPRVFATDDNASLSVARTYVDLDFDGELDLYATTRTGYSEFDFNEVKAWSNDAPNKFTAFDVNLANSFISLVHGRKLVISDFNNDNKPDVFALGHGYDNDPFPGEKLRYILSNATSYTSYEIDETGFWHGGAAGDINNDNNADVLIVDGTEKVYVLYGNGDGTFEDMSDLLSADHWGHYNLELLDINGDDVLDIVMGGHDYGTDGGPGLVYLGVNTGGFSDTPIQLPSMYGYGVILDFATADLDNDGSNELIVGLTNDPNKGPGFYLGYAANVYEFDGSTLTYSFTALTGDSWSPWVQVDDIDGDGDKDIFTDDKGEYRVWRNSLND